jgi:general nucleoside transport system permease protein
VKQSLRTPISLAVLSLIGLALLLNSTGATTMIKTATDTDIFALPDIAINTTTSSALAFALMVIGAIASFFYARKLNRKTPLWVTLVYGFALIYGVLVWLFAGATMPISALLSGALALAVPLVFGSLAGVLSERVGIVNIAIDSQLLAGAFISAVAATLSHNLYVGLIGAVIGGALVSWVLATFAIKYVVDQIIVGVVLNVLIVGLTNFLYSTLLADNVSLFNQPPRFDRILIPLLGQIPVIGPVMFNQTLIVYLMYLAVAGVWLALFKTRWGLRVRAVGEYPKAADTVGIKVFRTRYMSVMIGGALAGLGGAFFTLGQVGAFGKEMTNGAGYIALAALIFGRWNPIYAAFAALLFGFAQNLQYGLAIIGSPVPSEFLLMLPYALTAIAVAGLVGKVTGPAAAGKPYIKN